MRKINIDAQGFDDIHEHNDFYIDKTSFIREWWEDLDCFEKNTGMRVHESNGQIWFEEVK